MEKFMQRENNVLIGYGNPPKAQRSEDMDFNDVFGGPPRRFSMQEVRVRYSFGEAVEAEEEEKASSPWSSITEKPVFGEETGPRRRHQGDDFFDDIFRGGSESYSSPRRSDNVFGSSPGSRIMSPAKPLPPILEPFGTSLPTQFSLPAKLTKAIELPTFGSNNHGQHKTDATTNALNSPHSSSPLSRFSNQAIKGHDKIRNEVHPFHRQSPLSRQTSFSSQDSRITATSDQKDDTDNFEKEHTKNVDSFGNQFHFSIYKWAGKGVPMLLSLVAGNNLKSKGDSNYDRSARKTSSVIQQGLSTTEAESLKVECENEDLLRSKEATKEHQSTFQEAVYEIPESISQRSSNDNVVYDVARQIESDIGEKIEKEVPLKKEKSLENEPKPLRALHSDEDEQPVNVPETKESKARTLKGVNANTRDSKNAKKNVAKGKVREFIQIFNQEADSKPKADFRRRSQSSRWKNLGLDQNENEVSSNAAKANEKFSLQDEDKKSDVSLKVDENLNNDEAREHSSNHIPTNLKKSFSSEKIHRDSKISVENFDDPLEDNFVVQVLSDDHEKVTQDESSEDKKAIDAKIQQWSVGKKGNIRSLLSTLQYVLWAGSGWKPVPLVDLIEANAVKRAYQKALLRLHPDKLQQKGAAFHHKYIAEKVFDIVQEAWDHFNTCSS